MQQVTEHSLNICADDSLLLVQATVSICLEDHSGLQLMFAVFLPWDSFSILQPEWGFEVKPHSTTPTLNLSLALTDYGMKLKLWNMSSYA